MERELTTKSKRGIFAAGTMLFLLLAPVRGRGMTVEDLVLSQRLFIIHAFPGSQEIELFRPW